MGELNEAQVNMIIDTFLRQARVLREDADTYHDDAKANEAGAYQRAAQFICNESKSHLWSDPGDGRVKRCSFCGQTTRMPEGERRGQN